MVALGLSNAEIARRLDVTVHAVKFHLSHVYRKLGVSNRTEAAVAFQVGAARSNGQEALHSEWNATTEPVPDCCVHELISSRAAQQPDSVADGERPDKLLSLPLCP